MTVEQIHFALLPFLTGAVMCAVMIGVRNKSVDVRKRRRTKLDLALIPAENANSSADSEFVVRVIPKTPAYTSDAPETENGETANSGAKEETPSTKILQTATYTPSGASDKITQKIPAIEKTAEHESEFAQHKNVFSAPMKIRKLEEPQSPSIDATLAQKTQKMRRLPDTVRMKNRKVLLAEDMAHNRELISMFFEGTGLQFDFAETGIEAVTKFENNPNGYSLILMDIQMPEMDGLEAARMIRANNDPWAKQIPIIAMTADVMKDDIDACFDAGMDDHVAKPIEMDSLIDKVFEFITMSSE